MTKTSLHVPLEEYARKYENIGLTRADGVLEVVLHTRGDSLQWAPRIHEELGYCFGDIANDPENKVVILTGAGDTFCIDLDRDAFDLSARTWAGIHQEGRRMINNLLAIEVPVIGVVNGPAHIHAELLLMSDIVLASENASLSDTAHFTAGWVPGDGVHVFWPMVLGRTRASYFLLTGETIDVQRAEQLGLVNEILPRGELMFRARSLAEGIAAQPRLVRHYTRGLLTHDLRQKMHDQLGHGLALEGMAFLDEAKAFSACEGGA